VHGNEGLDLKKGILRCEEEPDGIQELEKAFERKKWKREIEDDYEIRNMKWIKRNRNEK
jgi:hypothetical protein